MKRIFYHLAHLPVWILRLVFLLAFIWLLSGVGARFFNYTSEPPKVDKAPWAVQTYTHIDGQAIPSRIYYAKVYKITEGVPMLEDYWEFDGKRFKYRNDTKEFPQSEWGPIKVVRRPG